MAKVAIVGLGFPAITVRMGQLYFGIMAWYEGGRSPLHSLRNDAIFFFF